MELRHLKTFTVVAQTSGFTKAAEQLGYAQSSVTAQIQSLEEELGAPLFDRLGKTVILTEVGRRLMPYAQEILRLQATAQDVAKSGDTPTGTVTIGAPESLAAYRLPSLIKEYRQRFPKVKIILKPGACSEFRNQLRSGELDVAFVLEPFTESPDLYTERLANESLVLISPLDHPLRQRSSVLDADLHNETLLHTEPGCSYRELFDRHLHNQGVEPSATMEFWSIEAIKNCVMSGLGISILPRITVESELRDQKIAALAWNSEVLLVSTQLVYHKSKWISPALRELLNLVHDHARTWRS